MHRELSLPLLDCIKGVILLTVVLPPIEDYVGRVGTGLAFYRKPDNCSSGQASSTWSDPKPCSLTALSIPLRMDEEAHPETVVLDLVFFVCDNRGDDVGGGNKENGRHDDRQWWDQLSSAVGLFGSENVFREFDIGTTDHSGQDDHDTSEERRSNRTAPMNKKFIWTIHNLANLPTENNVYPFAETVEGDFHVHNVPTLYYYAWKAHQLLDARSLSFERLMLMEMKPIIPTNGTIDTQEEETKPDQVELWKRLHDLLEPDELAGDSLVDPPEESCLADTEALSDSQARESKDDIPLESIYKDEKEGNETFPEEAPTLVPDDDYVDQK